MDLRPGLINELKELGQKVVAKFQEELKHIRQSSIDLDAIKNIKVEAYEGVSNDLYQIATVNVINALSVQISPWDKNIMLKIEQAVKEAFPHVSLVSKDGSVYVNFPPLTEESLQKVIKQLRGITEDYRQNLRRVRNNVKSKLDEAKNSNTISDEEYRKILEELDKVTRDFRTEIEKLAKQKEQNILGK